MNPPNTTAPAIEKPVIAFDRCIDTMFLLFGRGSEWSADGVSGLHPGGVASRPGSYAR
jgi:hypothetical protein